MNRGTLSSIIAALAFIMFFVLVMPQYDAIKLFRETVAARETLFAERSAIISRIQELERQAETRQADIDRLSTFMPQGKQIDEIVSSLEKIAANSGMQLNVITTSEAGAATAEDQKRVFISIDLTGTYPNLINFLKSLEQNLRLYDVSEIIVSPATITGPGNNLNFALKMYAYYLE